MMCSFLLSCGGGVGQVDAYMNFRSEQKSHTVDKGEIKYIDRGEGEVILLLHGVPSSGWLYRKMMDGLVASGYRVIVPDMLGYGNSSNPEGYELYKPEKQAERLVSLMDELGVKKWNHVFHDAGGMWTWELVRNHKHRVNKLVMLNSVNLKEGFFPPLKMKDDMLAKTAMWGYRKHASNELLIDKLFEETVRKPELVTLSDKAGYRVPLLEGKTNGIYFFFTQTCNALPDYSSVIENANIKTTVIWGKSDKMLQWKPQAKRLTKMLDIRQSDIHEIRAKHFIQEEKPQEVNAIIVDFLRK